LLVDDGWQMVGLSTRGNGDDDCWTEN